MVEVIMHASVEKCKMYSMHHVKTKSVSVQVKTHQHIMVNTIKVHSQLLIFSKVYKLYD